jgi:carboxyl-terminal processing protease
LGESGVARQRLTWAPIRLLVLLGLFGWFPLSQDATPALAWAGASSTDWREQARLAEANQDWETACRLYYQLHLADRQDAELRALFLASLRRLQQHRRHRDESYRQRIAKLNLTQASTLASDMITRLNALHVERDKSSLQALYAAGVDELRLALGSREFRRWFIPQASDTQVQSFQEQLERSWKLRSLRNATDLKRHLRDLALEAQKQLGLNPAIAIMELASGASHSLDEYTGHVTPGQLSEDALAALERELAGLGLVLSIQDERLIISRILPGSWAATTFLREGDRVTQLGRAVPERLTPTLLAELVQQVGDAPLELSVAATPQYPARTIRLPLTHSSVVESRIIETAPAVGYIRMVTFEKNTPAELYQAIEDLRFRGMESLILDLRGNSGGNVGVAIQLAERFLSEGVIVTTEGPALNKTFSSTSGTSAYSFPVVLLVDQQTCSAAELFAGALRDHHRALLVGQTTFGKSTISGAFPVRASLPGLPTAEAGVLRLTLARFVLPRGQAIGGVGLTPDVLEPNRERQMTLAIEHATRALTMRPMLME